MIIRSILAAIVFIATHSIAIADDTNKRQVVLVASEGSTLASMSNSDVRRAYLGLLNSAPPDRVLPIGNRSDRLLYEVFLQKIMFMSARNYERQMLSHVYQTGNQRLMMYESQAEVVQQLQKTPNTMSYMWENQARNTPGLRILQTIWEGNVE